MNHNKYYIFNLFALITYSFETPVWLHLQIVKCQFFCASVFFRIFLSDELSQHAIFQINTNFIRIEGST